MQVAAQGEYGGGIVFLEVPDNYLIQINHTLWKPHLADIWLITGVPQGTQFVAWQSESGPQIRDGHMVWLRPREVIVYEWNANLELFQRVKDVHRIEAYQSGHDDMSLLQKGVLYPIDNHQDWLALTYAIQPITIDMLQHQKLSSHPDIEYDANQNSIESFNESVLYHHESLAWSDITSLKNRLKNANHNSPLNLDRSPDVISLGELLMVRVNELEDLDEHNHKSSSLLASKFNLNNSSLFILAELQSAFLHFILGSRLCAFDQWKKLYGLLSNADCLAESTSPYYSLGGHWLQTLVTQLDHMPECIVQSDITKSNFIIAAVLDTIETFTSENATQNKYTDTVETLRTKVASVFNMSIVELETLQEERITLACDPV